MPDRIAIPNYTDRLVLLDPATSLYYDFINAAWRSPADFVSFVEEGNAWAMASTDGSSAAYWLELPAGVDPLAGPFMLLVYAASSYAGFDGTEPEAIITFGGKVAATTGANDMADLPTARAVKIDNLDATISSRSTYAGGDTAGTTTLLSEITAIKGSGWTSGDNLRTLSTRVDTLLTRITSTIFDGITSLGHWLRAGFRKSTPDATALGEINTGGGTFASSTDSLEAAAERLALIDPPAGARTVTITVDDGTDPVEGAKVRLTSGLVSHVGTTDADGEVILNVDDATWAVAITAAGYTFAGDTITVDGAETETFSLTANTIEAAEDPDQTTAYLYAYDVNNDVVAGAVFEFVLVGPVDPAAGQSFPRDAKTVTSDADGLVSFNALQAAKYKGRRFKVEALSGDRWGNWVEFTTGSAGTYAIPQLNGLQTV